MKLSDCPMFTDENISPELVLWLRSVGFDVFDILENSLGGTDDERLLELVHSMERAVISHDSDFGKLTISHNQ